MVDKPINKLDSSKKRARSPDLDSDSSDEDIFRDLNLSRKAEEDDDDADESQDYKNLKQVETLNDVEEHICISPDHEPYSVSIPEKRENHSSSSCDIQEVEDEDDDPLLCASINDSDLINQPLDDNEKVTVKVRFALEVCRIQITRTQFFKTVIQELSEKSGVDPNKITLFFNNDLLDPHDTLKTVPIRIDQFIDAAVTNEAAVAPVTNENMIELKVQSQSRNKGSQVVISLRPTDPMTVLFQKYAEATSTPLEKILKFKFDGDVIEEDDTPLSLDLEGGECIDVHIKSDN